jgi:hypothetical protein
MIWIGDVHGCAKTLLALIKQLPKNRQVGFLGDLVDRGPDSVEAMKIALDSSDTILCGNHDMMMVKCLLTDRGNWYLWNAWNRNGNRWARDMMNLRGPRKSILETLAMIESLYERMIIFKMTERAIATHAFADKTIWCEGYQRPIPACEVLAMKMSGHNAEMPDNAQVKMPTAAEAIENILAPGLKQRVFDADVLGTDSLLWGRRMEESKELAGITGKKLIHGHSIPRDGEVYISDALVLVDTGCCMGREAYLSAYDDETGEIWRQANIEDTQ